MAPDYMVHAGREPVQRDPPPVDKRKRQQPTGRHDLRGAPAIVVREAVAGCVEHAQLPLPFRCAARVLLLEFYPQFQTEQVEVGAQCVGAGVAPVESTVGAVREAQGCLAAGVVRSERGDQHLRRLVMELAGEALELRCQAQDQRVVQLLGDPAPAGIGNPDGPMRGEQPVEPGRAVVLPVGQGGGRHG